VSASLAKTAAERSGAPVHVGQLTDLDLPKASFDWANFDQVLSYVPNPREVVRKATGLLRPGGICRIREYNPDSLSARLKGQKYWMYGPTIVNVWPPKAIRVLAAATILRVERALSRKRRLGLHKERRIMHLAHLFPCIAWARAVI